MFDTAKKNPLATIATVLTIIVTLGSATYGFFQKLDEFVTEVELEKKSDSISIEIIDVAIMRYEDDYMRLNIKIELNTADEYDRAQKTNIERRLLELKAKKLALETKAIYN